MDTRKMTLVERLRNRREMVNYGSGDVRDIPDEDCEEAAARIVELEAEVERYKVALEDTIKGMQFDRRESEKKLEAELEVAKGLDRSRNVEAREITSEFVRLQTTRIAELEAECGTLQAQRDMAIIALILTPNEHSEWHEMAAHLR